MAFRVSTQFFIGHNEVMTNWGVGRWKVRHNPFDLGKSKPRTKPVIGTTKEEESVLIRRFPARSRADTK